MVERGSTIRVPPFGRRPAPGREPRPAPPTGPARALSGMAVGGRADPGTLDPTHDGGIDEPTESRVAG